MSLNIARCSRRAARYACENYHYSRRLASGKLVCYGVWEKGRFVGAVVYGRGATPHIAKPFGLTQKQVCELVRVALKEHEAPVTRIIAVTNRLLKRENPGVEIVVSYVDPEQGHLGRIYQAGNWFYLGKTKVIEDCLVGGKVVHKRTVTMRYGSASGFEYVKKQPKYKYGYPLTRWAREQLEQMTKPYPKKAAAGETGSGVQPE